MSWEDAALLTLLGVVAMIAFLCINKALSIAPASVVVPYQYTTIFLGDSARLYFLRRHSDDADADRRRHHHRRRHLYLHSRADLGEGVRHSAEPPPGNQDDDGIGLDLDQPAGIDGLHDLDHRRGRTDVLKNSPWARPASCQLVISFR